MIDVGGDRKDYSYGKYKSFEAVEGAIHFNDVRLREYINSSMTNAEFTKSLKNMLLVKRSYENGRYYRSDVPRAETESLSNTPATQALVATAEIMKEFKRKNNLDITSLVMIQDGEADWTNSYTRTKTLTKENGQEYSAFRESGFDLGNNNIFVVDKKNKFETKLSMNRDNVNKAVLSWFAKVTNSKVFGFYIISDNRAYARKVINEKYTLDNGLVLGDCRYKDYYMWEAKIKELTKQFKDEKFLATKVDGYNEFFLVAGGNDLKTEDDEIAIEGSYSTRKLATAFAKMNKKKSVNRVLVSRFIQGIAA
jgi:hypothetical protein